MAGGEVAAQGFVDRMAALVQEAGEPAALLAGFRSIDSKLEGSVEAGETTGLLLVLGAEEIWGASVGDSQAWLVTETGLEDLTEHQERKPLVGSGRAAPTVFSTPRRPGVQGSFEIRESSS